MPENEDVYEARVRLTLSIPELRKLVELLAIARDALEIAEENTEEDESFVDHVTGLYFQLMKDISDAVGDD